MKQYYHKTDLTGTKYWALRDPTLHSPMTTLWGSEINHKTETLFTNYSQYSSAYLQLFGKQPFNIFWGIKK